MQDHALVQLGDAVAAGAAEREREDRVQETSHATEHHAQAEARGHAGVLQVALAHRVRMFSEKTPQTHGARVGETP